MYTKIINQSAFSVIAGFLLLATGLVNAQVSHGPDGNPYTFTGEIRLVSTTPIAEYVCDLELTSTLDDGSSSTDGFVTVVITGGVVEGNFPCGLITLQDLPWGHTDNGEIVTGGAIVDLNDIRMNAPFGLLSCSGDISVPFNSNATASDLNFNGLSFGGCTFSGTGGPQNVLFADPANNVTVP